MVFEPAVLAEVLRRVNAQVAAPVDAKTRG
jgi:hypothetical protein